MGYFGDYASKQEIIEEHKREGGLLKACIRGSIIWTLEAGVERNFIRCLKVVGKPGDYRYKPMSEEAGPFYYSCPLSYLEAAQEVNPQWRAKVRHYHQKFSIGEWLELKNCKPSRLQVVGIRPLRGVDETGKIWRIPRSAL